MALSYSAYAIQPLASTFLVLASESVMLSCDSRMMSATEMSWLSRAIHLITFSVIFCLEDISLNF